MWGADFPHHEGTAPYTLQVLRATLSSAPQDELRQVFAGNAASLYGADVEALQKVADRVGPRVGDVATPLPADEYPTDPNFWMLAGGPANAGAVFEQKH
jgi:hypothetical protein